MNNEKIADYSDEPLWRLKNYIYFEKRDEGILFSSGNKTFLIKSTSIYPLILKVISLMDQGFSLSGILNNSPAGAKSVIGNFVEQLISNDMLFDDRLLRKIQEKYSRKMVLHEDFFKYILENINYNDYQNVSSKFDNWFGLTISIIGDDCILKSVVKNVIATGIDSLKIGFCSNNADSYEELEGILRNSDIKYSIQKISDVSHLNRGTDLTILCFDDVETTPIASEILNLYRDDRKLQYMVASLVSGKAIISPIQGIDHASYSDLYHRLYRVADNTNRNDYSSLSLDVLGCIAVLNLITQFFGGMNNHANATFLEPDMSVSHHFIPPSSQDSSIQLHADIFKANYQAPENRDMNEFEFISLRMSPLFDKKIGIFDRKSIEHINQVPLAIDAIDIYLPNDKKNKNTTVYAWGNNPEQAGVNCLQQAILYYLQAINSELHTHTVIGFDSEDWFVRARATALCFAQLPDIKIKTVSFPLKVIEKTDACLLVYQVSSQLSGDISVLLSWIQGFNAFACSIFLDGNCISNAIGPYLLDSILNALGNIYMNRHLGKDLTVIKECQIHGAFSEHIDSATSFKAFQVYTENCTNQHKNLTFRKVIHNSLMEKICIVGHVEVNKINEYQ